MKSKRHRVPYVVRVLLTIIFLYIASIHGLSLLYLPLGIYLAVSIAWIILVEFFSEEVRKRPWNKIIRDVFDLVFFTLIVYMTGGASSFLILIYLGWTVGSSMQDKRVYGLVAVLGSCMLFGILMLLLGFNMLPAYDCFAESPVPFSAGRAAAAWIALFISTITIHDFVFKLYSKLLGEKIQLQLETKERALSVEAQRESEKKYRTLLQTNNVGYIEMDIYGNVTFCNDVIESFTGYTRDEMIGLNYAKIMSAEIAGIVFKIYRRVF